MSIPLREKHQHFIAHVVFSNPAICEFKSLLKHKKDFPDYLKLCPNIASKRPTLLRYDFLKSFTTNIPGIFSLNLL